MVLPIHDVEAPKEVIEAPCAISDGNDPTTILGDVDMRRVAIGEIHSPRRKHALIFSAGRRNWAHARLSRRAAIGLHRHRASHGSIQRGNDLRGLGIVEHYRAVDEFDFGNLASQKWAISDFAHGLGCGAQDEVQRRARLRLTQRRGRYTLHEMFTANTVNWQHAHDQTAGKPQQ